jgi:hypothetical protein
MERYAFSLISLISLIIGLYLCLGVNLALSIPSGQRDCDTSVVKTNSLGIYTIVTGSSVTVNNGSTARQCIIQFSTEVTTTAGDQTTLAYTIDSTNPANCIAIGPELFHAGNPYGLTETVTHIGVRNIGTGTHIIRPCLQTLDGNGGGATSEFFFRCLTVECRTQ